MNMPMCTKLIASTVLTLAAFTSSAQALLAGPMLGHVTESTADVWVSAWSGIEIDAVAMQLDKRVRGYTVRDSFRRFNVLRFEGLVPGRPVHIQVTARSEEWNETEIHDLFFSTSEPPESAGRLTIAFGSCAQDSRRPFVPVYEAIYDEHPDMAIFVGDNSYFIIGDGNWRTSGPIGDWNTADGMISRHMRTRTNPDLQRLLRTVPSYGIWDDHDYGPNNADREFENKDLALEIFKAVWANPSYGTEATPGIFSKFRRGPADIFLMDDRYHKYVATDERPDVPDEDAVIWGDAQLTWLMDELKRSVAPFKVIANGTQIIGQDGRGEGHFNEAPHEIQKLLTFLKEEEIGGVVILSGDRHYTEVMRLEQEGGPDIIEFTSSPMQQGQQVGPVERPQPTQLWAMRGNSYGLVTLEAHEDGTGTVRFEMRDASNYVPLREDGEPAVSEFTLESLQYE